MFNRLKRSFHNGSLFNGPMAVVALILALIAFGLSSRANAAPFPATASRFEVTVSGEGSDVILIAGLGCSGAVWDDTVAHLKAHHRVHVLTLAGIAGTPVGANTDGPILDPTVEVINDYVVANHLKDVTLIGHSIGGFIGLKLAIAHPQTLKKLIVVDTLPFIGVMMAPGATVQSITPMAENYRTHLMAMDEATFRASQKMGVSRLVSAPFVDKIVDWTLASDRHVFAQMMFEDMTTDLTPDLSKITAKIVVYVPTSPSSPYSPEQTEGFYKRLYTDLKGANFRRFDNSLHFIMYDQKDAFLSAVVADTQ